MSAGWIPGPAEPRLERGEVHVWLSDLDASGWPGADGLPEEERRRAERLVAPGAGARWAASRWALRRILGLHLHRPARVVELASREDGKPVLAGPATELRFNLSHSGGVALIAVARWSEVGVDVEELDPARDPLRLARHGLDPDDAARVAAAAPQDRLWEFHRLWTRREALGKCFGTGLTSAPPAEGATVIELDAGPGRAAALAVAGPAPAVSRFLLEPSLGADAQWGVGSRGSGVLTR